ncbi:thiopeptide-type bacteriocin biosynthesis protein [Streptomyces sp. VNUA24]|uniref:thiopeptide-type bacteriocin biosynthesis protein n=1 Tax=Streptomyces sp. VNUA24 TaxID=3031131 RepID=UPI0023B82C85|nr:thiopeptide-type bacteriocin biosynthesis protein [Streptomyces sp. VNUA24]WEH16438.1 thiopeptide-type bacteriocin biosynthesis protein [Streptomyces sp. VNUA24]
MDLPASSTIEQAVLAALTGTALAEAASQAQTSPEHLAETTEHYRGTGRSALDPQLGSWHQVNIEFTDYPTAEQPFRTYLLPALRTGPIGTWWFVRKHPCWRLRVQPGPGTRMEDAVAHLTEVLDSTLSRGVAKRWWSSLYEPETIAFGGTHGMTIAHTLFHTDSVGVLDYHQHMADSTSGLLGPKETSLLVTTLLLRAAGLEWGEQGDVWGQVETRRPLPTDVHPDQVSSMVALVRRLLTLDAGPALTDGPLTPLGNWVTGLEHCGRALADAARAGKLQLGLRGILARHILFHWNRMGFTTRQQAIWARAARETILGN